MLKTSSKAATSVAVFAGFVAITIFAALAGFLATYPASAATITVNTQVDAFLDGSDGKCSLREAIVNANEDAQTHTDCPPGDGEDTIVFQAGVTMITLVAGLPAISNADGLTVDGDDTVTISGDNKYVIFGTNGTGVLTLQDLTLTNGAGGAIYNDGTLMVNSSRVMNSNSAADGGAIANFDNGTASINGSTISGSSSLAGSGGGILNEGVMTITNTTVQGHHAAINGGAIANQRGGTLTLNSSTVKDSGADMNGGGIYNDVGTLTLNDTTVSGDMATNNGGGIWSNDDLTLNNSSVGEDNTAQYGGGIYSVAGEIVLNDSEITGNEATENGGGFLGLNLTLNHSMVTNNTAARYGGGINAEGSVTLDHSTVSGNKALTQGGGGFEVQTGTLTITNSVVFGNTAEAKGGGLDVVEGATATIVDSTVSDNDTPGAGGGILNDGSTITLLRTTLSDNTAAFGGGLRSDLGTATISNSTLSHNSASYGGGLYNGDSAITTLTNTTVTANLASMLGGGIYSPQDVANTVNLKNTIVADQTTNTDCDGLGFHSLGNNLDSGDNCNLDQPSDRPQTDVFLGLLANNGGPTKTHALLANSNAIDGGSDAVCTDDPINGIDQRGEERPSGAHCDIGAFEFESPTPTPTASPSPSPTGSPTSTPVRETQMWGDNNCDGDIDLQDAERGLIAFGLPERLESVPGCPDMGESIDFVDIHPAGAGTLTWGDAYCINGLNGIDVLVVLHYIAGTETIPFTAGFCPDVGDEVVFERQQ